MRKVALAAATGCEQPRCDRQESNSPSVARKGDEGKLDFCFHTSHTNHLARIISEPRAEIKPRLSPWWEMRARGSDSFRRYFISGRFRLQSDCGERRIPCSGAVALRPGPATEQAQRTRSARSSVGQSACFLNTRSLVRAQPGVNFSYCGNAPQSRRDSRPRAISAALKQRNTRQWQRKRRTS